MPVFFTASLFILFACQSNTIVVPEEPDVPTPEIKVSYPIVDTRITDFYTDLDLVSEISFGAPFYGQDAHYQGHSPTYTNNGDGTVSDQVTGLMWAKSMGAKMTFTEAFTFAENASLGGYQDWRVPTLKELQSIVDYSRSPQTSASAAIDPIFEISSITDPEGNSGHYPFFWTSTTHLDGVNPYASAVYIAFGEGQGQMHGQLMDVHGAGCQRSDPKSGSLADYPQYFGPQGYVRYVFNYVRCVRDIE